MAVEAQQLRPGGETVITRLADILVIQAIRSWIANDPAAQTGWLGALQDRQIGHALALVHRDPARSWTLASLADEVAMSGVGIEAGLLSLADAESFVGQSLVNGCVRVLIEPLDADPEAAVAHGAAMEYVLVRACVSLEQVHHGDRIASWAVSRRGLERGHGIRTGLEDTTVLPDGRPARDNAALVRAAGEMITAAVQFRTGHSSDGSLT